MKSRRAIHLVALATLAVTSSLDGQRRGGIEFGAFGQFTRYDPSLIFDDGPGVGGRLGMFLPLGLGLEGTIAYVSTTGASNVSVRQLPIHTRLVYAVPAGTRYAVLVGAGWVHNLYRKPTSQWEDGASGLLGARADLGSRVDARVDVVADFYSSPLNESNAVSDNWTFSLAAGVGVRLGGGGGGDRASETPIATA